MVIKYHVTPDFSVLRHRPDRFRGPPTLLIQGAGLSFSVIRAAGPRMTQLWLDRH
jgi:hypothetical protein